MADGSLAAWDLATGQRTLALRGADSVATAVAVRPDGTQLVSGHEDGSLHVWSPDQGRLLARRPGGRAAIRALAVAGQGDLVLSSAADGTLRLWRLDEDFAVTITVAKSEWAAFTDDGKYFGSEYASTLLHRVWDTANGPVIEQLPVDPRGDELRTQLGLRPARAARTE